MSRSGRPLLTCCLVEVSLAFLLAVVRTVSDLVVMKVVNFNLGLILLTLVLLLLGFLRFLFVILGLFALLVAILFLLLLLFLWLWWSNRLQERMVLQSR